MSVKHLEEKRRSLEEKTKALEEKARVEKLAIDRRLFSQILQEENRTHEAAIKELEDKMASLDQQMKSSYVVEDVQSQISSEPVPETVEPAPEVSYNVSEDASAGMSQESDSTYTQSRVEAAPETPKKRKRGLF